MKNHTDDQIENMLSNFRSVEIKEFSLYADVQKRKKNFIVKRIIPISVSSFVALIAVFVILVNASSAFADVCKQIPVLNSVSNALTLSNENSTSNESATSNEDTISNSDQNSEEEIRLTSPDDINDPTQTDNYFDNPSGKTYDNIKEGIMPDLMNSSGTDAVAMLKQAKIVGYRLGYKTSPTVPEGKVCFQSIVAGTEMDSSMTVAIYVSMGPNSDPNYIPPLLSEPKMVTYQGSRYLNCGTYAVLKYWDKVTETASIPSQVTLNGKTMPVTTIVEAAFSGQAVKAVVIPSSVTSIQNNAFMMARSLTTVSMPNSVKTIGNLAFANCTSLTSISIPESVQTLGDNLFNGDTSLRSVTIAGNVRTINDNAFYGCSSLTSVTLPDSVTSIGNYAFFNCLSLSSIRLPNALSDVKRQAFWGCSALKSITIPSSVKSLGVAAFQNCGSPIDFYFLGNAPTFDGLPFDWPSPNTHIHIAEGTTGWTSPTWSSLGIPGVPVVPSVPSNPSVPSESGTSNSTSESLTQTDVSSSPSQ